MKKVVQQSEELLLQGTRLKSIELECEKECAKRCVAHLYKGMGVTPEQQQACVNNLLDPSGHYIIRVIRVNKLVLFRLSTRHVILLFWKEVLGETSTISTKYYKSNWGK